MTTPLLAFIHTALSETFPDHSYVLHNVFILREHGGTFTDFVAYLEYSRYRYSMFTVMV